MYGGQVASLAWNDDEFFKRLKNLFSSTCNEKKKGEAVRGGHSQMSIAHYGRKHGIADNGVHPRRLPLRKSSR